MAEKSATEVATLRVAFQGEPGAYSEQAVYELLGKEQITAVNYPSFEAAFAAASSGEVDLLLVPIENSLGGTVHANFDLQLQHSLFIIAEHDFRVKHSLMALPGTTKADLKKIISHPQALAQCDSYIKKLGTEKEATYDTAGSAKMIMDGQLKGVAAICSELAAPHYGLEILDRSVEDDPDNYTRFLLLRKNPVQIPAGLKCKTSIVFSLENNAGALFKALSAFALRDIDLCKIESRPCKRDVMERLERLFRGMNGTMSFKAEQRPGSASQSRPGSADDASGPRAQYRYVFYVDFLAPMDEQNTSNALRHLMEMTTFFRVLGTYPRGGSLAKLENLGMLNKLPAGKARRRVGIMGFGNFGQFIAKKLVMDFQVFATSRSDASEAAASLGVAWCSTLDELLDQQLDALIISVSILSFESMVRKLVEALSKTKSGVAQNMLIIDVLSVKVHAKTTLLTLLPETCDILCTHPMFGPESGKHGWNGLPFVFERVRTREARRCEEFVNWWSEQGCRMIPMSCEEHDEHAAGSQFVTHFTGRVLSQLGVRSTPINTMGFESLLRLVENTCKDSFDLFYALFKFNPSSAQQLKSIEEAIQSVSQDLRAGSSPPAD